MALVKQNRRSTVLKSHIESKKWFFKRFCYLITIQLIFHMIVNEPTCLIVTARKMKTLYYAKFYYNI